MTKNKTRTSVVVKDYETIQQSLRRFKRKVEASGKLETLKKKQAYEKPTTKRKREKGAAIARYKKKMKKEEKALMLLRKR